MGVVDSLDTKSNSSDQLDSPDLLLDQDNAKMYKDLGVSDEEIQRFEADFQKEIDEIKTQGQGEYSPKEVETQENQSMRAVLSDTQYKKYLDWKKSNPTTD